MSEKKPTTPAELWALWDYESWLMSQIEACYFNGDEQGALDLRRALAITQEYREMRGGLPSKLKD